MGRRSQTRDSFEAIRYAVDTGSMPPPRRRSRWAQKRVVLPVAAVTALGAGLLFQEMRRQPAATATATLDCSSARDVWRPACRPENLQTWVAKAASARDEAPAATGTIDESKRAASTQKRVVEAKPKPEPAPVEAAPVRTQAAEPVRAPEPIKPAEPVRVVEAKPEPVKAAPQPVEPAAKAPEPPRWIDPVAQVPAPRPAEAVAKLPEAKPVEQAPQTAEPQIKAEPAAQAARPEPPPAAVPEPVSRPAQAKIADEAAAREKRLERLARRTAKREARAAARAEQRQQPRVRTVVVREEPPRRSARVRSEPGVRTTAYFPPGFVQALRHYNTRYAYDY